MAARLKKNKNKPRAEQEPRSAHGRAVNYTNRAKTKSLTTIWGIDFFSNPHSVS